MTENSSTPPYHTKTAEDILVIPEGFDNLFDSDKRDRIYNLGVQAAQNGIAPSEIPETFSVILNSDPSFARQFKAGYQVGGGR